VYSISVLFIGVAAALLLFAIRAKVAPDTSRKTDKSQQKVEILKQLLALSEREGNLSATASSVRLRPQSTKPNMRETGLKKQRT
jgi:hypothetical protein